MSERIPIYNPYFPKLKTEKYERYLPSAFDESNSMLEKINNIIEYIRLLSSHYENTLENLDDIRQDQYQRIEDLYDDFYKIKLWIESREEHLREDFSALEDWVKGAGLRLQTKHILTQWLNDGRLADVINEEVFDMKANSDYVDNLEQHDKFYGSPIQRKKPKPMIVWIDDDGHVGFKEKLMPLGLKYGIPFTSAFITSRIGETRGDNRYMTEEEIKECIDNGMEIISHGHYSHDINKPPNSWGKEELIADLKESQKVLKKLGANYRGHAEPFGSYNTNVIDYAREVFSYNVGTANRGNRINTEDNFNNYEIKRTSGERLTLSEIEDMIDETIEKNGLLVFTSHVDQGYGFSVAKTEGAIKYALARGVEWVTLETAMQHHGNILEFNVNGYEVDRITASGKLYGNSFGRVIHDNNPEIGNDTPLTYFEGLATTHSMIRLNQMDGFPSQSPAKSGMLMTYRGHETEEVWNYQIFTTTRNKREFIRWWNHEAETPHWTEWVDVSPTQYLGINAVDHDVSPNDNRLFRKLSYSSINNRLKDNFPEGKSGHLVTNSFVDGSFAMQEYHIYQENKLYKRWWNATENKWNEWLIEGGLLINEPNEVTPNKKPSEFDVGITIDTITLSGSDEFPSNVGTLTTVKSARDGFGRFTRQTFEVVGSYSEYKRHELRGDVWSDWARYRPSDGTEDQ